MGTRYNFICGDCGYEAEVSGDDDAGTIGCNTCKTIRDVVNATWSTDQPESVLLQWPSERRASKRRSG